MNQKIKEQDEKLKAKEEELKRSLHQDSNRLKNKASRVGKVALAAGIVSLLLYWIYKAFFYEEPTEQEHTKKVVKAQSPSFLQRLWTVLSPYATKMLTEYFQLEEKQDKKAD